MNRKLITFIFILVVSNTLLSCQESNRRLFRYFEVFGGIGTSHYFGDIGGAYTEWPGFLDHFDNFRDFDPLETRLSLSAGARYVFNKTFAASGQMAPVWLSGSDFGSQHQHRGYYFNTYMLEFSAQMEWYFLSKEAGWNPYILAGYGATARYTKAFYGGETSASYTGGVLLSGFGFKISNNKRFTHAAELGFRYAISDYIEMYNGGTGKNDVYYIVQYKLSYHLTRGTIYTRKGLVRKSLWDQMRFKRHRNMTDEELWKATEATEMTDRERRKIERYLKRIRKK